MALESDTPDVRNLVTIGLVSIFVTIAITYYVIGLTHSERLELQASRAASTATAAPAMSEEAKQAVIQKYAH
jgi:hypothetical protein